MVENYIRFSYPKSGKVVMESEISKFGEDEKCWIHKCNQCVTYMWPNCDSSETYIRSIYNPFCDLFETHKPRSHSRMKSCECALIANVNGYSSIRSIIRHSQTTENKS